ncbi:MAG: hypothetical protein U0359_23535 [Byssovorax sp.]
MAILLQSIRALENSSYEVTIMDGDGAKTFIFSYNERRQSISTDAEFENYASGRLKVRDLAIALGRFARGQMVDLPLTLKETTVKERW